MYTTMAPSRLYGKQSLHSLLSSCLTTLLLLHLFQSKACQHLPVLAYVHGRLTMSWSHEPFPVLASVSTFTVECGIYQLGCSFCSPVLQRGHNAVLVRRLDPEDIAWLQVGHLLWSPRR